MQREIIISKEKQLSEKGYLVFSQSDLESMSASDAENIKEHFHGVALMQLPEGEKEFFEWLKEADTPVWNDLWEDAENPYFVSTDLLHHFIPDGNGFPICDLIDEPNYWFNARHIKPKGAEKFKTIEEKLDKNLKLNFEETFLVEIMQGSIDVWHFCYKYNFPVRKAKIIIQNMHRDDILIHLTDREDLIKYLDV
jgi:hypothetical protein